MTCIVIDDEQDGVETMLQMLENYCPSMKVLGTANSALDGVKLINSTLPDIVFLDVEMPHGNGFDVIEATQDKDYHIIFTTAYHHYAIKAIKVNALDYLMKPVDIDELVAAVKRAEQANVQRQQEQRTDNMLDMLRNDRLQKLPVYHKGEYIFVASDDIIYFNSEGSYTHIVTKTDQLLTSKNLKYYDELLSDDGFFRVNNSFLVNMSHIARYLREDGGILQMSNDMKVTISKNRREELKKALQI